MEIESFVKKCKKSKNTQKFYFLFFDRYNYIECFDTHEKCSKLLKESFKSESLYYLKSENTCIQESEYYLKHIENISKLKAMGYVNIGSF
jgi:hypothetical protein